MQSKKKTILAVAALVVIAAVLLLVWRAVTPKGEAGEKTITVQVLHKDGVRDWCRSTCRFNNNGM